jgi:hypothetical protein
MKTLIEMLNEEMLPKRAVDFNKLPEKNLGFGNRRCSKKTTYQSFYNWKKF